MSETPRGKSSRPQLVPRTIFDADHDAFREMVRSFIAKEILPNQAQWEQDGKVSREVWLAAGRQGLLGLNLDPAYGGGGVDFLFNVVLVEELAAARVSGAALPLQNDTVGPYFDRFCTDEQRLRWLPGICSGELITAIAMTEPGTGSDVAAIRTTAHPQGDHYVLNGQKTFITNGILSDLIVVAARTSEEGRSRGISLLVVERGMPGFERGRNLEKVGQHAQDTAELFFADVHVPKANLLGVEGQGFKQLMQNLPQERVSIAVSAVASATEAFASTLEYARTRTAFGQPIGSFQYNRFTLAEIATEVQIAQMFLDRCLTELVAGKLDAVTAAMLKWWTTELEKRVVDRCVQLHGGYGYMLEYPIARAYVDSRIQTIYGGTTEIMKEVIGRSFGI